MLWWQSLWSVIGETWSNTPGAVRTIIIAGVGTIVGAWVSSRSQTKPRVIDELKAIGSARALCFYITNRAIGLKRQHVLPMKQRFDQAVTTIKNHKTGPLEISMDLNELVHVKFPDNILEKVIFEKCNVGTRISALAVALSGSIDELRNAIDYRKTLISEFRGKRNSMSDREKIEFYVGAVKAGETDVRFSENIKSLSTLTDSCIYFSMALTDQLTLYGNKLRFWNNFRFRMGIPEFLPADWSEVKHLLPDASKYSDWRTKFKPYPTKTRRLLSWLRSSIFRR
jgi:hypothetical protein